LSSIRYNRDGCNHQQLGMHKSNSRRTLCPIRSSLRFQNVAFIFVIILLTVSTHVNAEDVQVSNEKPKSAKEKAWEEKIEKSATNLAEALLGKVAEVAGTATPGKAGEVSGNRSGSAVQKKGPKHLPEAVTDFVNSIFGDSFIGRTVAGLVLKVVDWIGAQFEHALFASNAVYENATARIMTSKRLKSAMGGSVSKVGPITSNFIGLMNENGVSGQSVNLTFLVYGPTGKTASASVISFQSDSFNKMAITVRLLNGKVIQVEESGAAPELGQQQREGAKDAAADGKGFECRAEDGCHGPKGEL